MHHRNNLFMRFPEQKILFPSHSENQISFELKIKVSSSIKKYQFLADNYQTK